jgi:HK97 family phage major capsid protein
MPSPVDVSGLIPTTVSAQVQQEVQQQSIALQLGQRVPMPAGVSVVPVPRSFPKAGWVATGERKPYTDFAIGTVPLTAEEVAAVIAIPDVYLEDIAINLWNYARPLLAEAIAIALDLAALWGIDAPPTFPVGGVEAVAQSVPAGTDVVDTVNNAMSAVEAQGLRVTGSAADLSVRGALRGVRDSSGAFLLGTTQAGTDAVDALYGVPISFNSFDLSAPNDFLTGDWSRLIIGVRQDIRYQMSSEGVIADDGGAVKISAFQDNMTLMKVWARYGCVIMRPATRRFPNDPWANPFAKSNIGPGMPGGESGGNGDVTETSATKATGATKKAS